MMLVVVVLSVVVVVVVVNVAIIQTPLSEFLVLYCF